MLSGPSLDLGLFSFVAQGGLQLPLQVGVGPETGLAGNGLLE